MSKISGDWIVFLMFFLLFAGFMIVEAVWLNRKGWTSFGKSLGFSILINSIGFFIGFFVFIIIGMITFAMTFNGLHYTEFPLGGEYGQDAVLILAALFTPLLLIICKRIFLSLLKIQTGKSAWFYSVVSSILILVISLGIPILTGYFLFS